MGTNLNPKSLLNKQPFAVLLKHWPTNLQISSTETQQHKVSCNHSLSPLFIIYLFKYN